MTDYQAIIIICIGIAIIFFATSLRCIDHNSFGVITFLGRRTRKVKGEGIRLIPFYGFICGLIQLSKKKRAHSFKQKFRTTDRVEVEFSFKVIWVPSEKYAIEFLNVYTGGDSENEVTPEQHFNSILEGKVREYLREWVKTQDWESAIDFEEQALKSLVSKFFDLDDDTIINSLTKSLRNGLGERAIPALGIVMNYFIIEDVQLQGDVSRQAEQRIVRRLKGEEEIEGIAFVKRIAELLHITEMDALRIMQIERGKVAQRIDSLNINASPEVVANALSLINEYKRRYN